MAKANTRLAGHELPHEGRLYGGCGGGYYYGITDDGRQWFDTAGALHPDGTPSRDSCECCPPKPIKPARTEPTGTQLDLLSPVAFFTTAQS